MICNGEFKAGSGRKGKGRNRNKRERCWWLVGCAGVGFKDGLEERKAAGGVHGNIY